MRPQLERTLHDEDAMTSRDDDLIVRCSTVASNPFTFDESDQIQGSPCSIAKEESCAEVREQTRSSNKDNQALTHSPSPSSVSPELTDIITTSANGTSSPMVACVSSVASPPSVAQWLPSLSEHPLLVDESTLSSRELHVLRRKIDLRCLPSLFLLHLLNYQARTCVGNARELGMANDLNLSSQSYSLLLCIFFLGYGLFEIPGSLWISASRPSLILPAMLFLSGCLCISVVFVETGGQMIAQRLLLGISQSGFFSGIINLLDRWYKTEEVGKRFAIVFSASILAGSANGVVSFGIVTTLEGALGIRGWKWLFLLVGIASSIAGLAFVFVLPDYPMVTSWLSTEQKRLAQRRMDQVPMKDSLPSDIRSSLTAAMKDTQTWLMCVAYVCIHTAGSISYFIPTIVHRHGHQGRSGQLYSALPYLCTLVCMFPVVIYGDRLRERGYHAAASAACASGFAFVLVGIRLDKTAYFTLLCCFAAALWTAMVSFIMYIAHRFERPQQKRNVCTSMIIASANIGIVGGTALWPAIHAPRYSVDWLVMGIVCAVNASITLSIRLGLARDRPPKGTLTPCEHRVTMGRVLVPLDYESSVVIPLVEISLNQMGCERIKAGQSAASMSTAVAPNLSPSSHDETTTLRMHEHARYELSVGQDVGEQRVVYGYF